MNSYIGIDPGQGGGIAIIYANKVIAVTSMPVAGKDIDVSYITNWMYANVYWNYDVIACIEKVSARPGQGVVSMFKFGYNVGVVHGVLGAMGIPRHLVTPQTWKKEVLIGMPKDKDAAIEYCRAVFPDVSLFASKKSKKMHTGIADAICIAKYASMKL